MSRSRKKNPTTADIPKGSWKHEYNSRLRTTSNQLLKQVINGKIDPDELVLPELEETGDEWVSPKEDVHYWNFEHKQNFLDSAEEELYYERLENYEKAFRK